ncbi:MAG: porin, partial [Gammaproteobacteria bacterium]|nr:porin [Gammaproteobacteria bacterium]
MMKNSLLAIAVAASMAAPAVMAAAPTIYGNIHLTILDLDSNNDLDLTSNTSAIGVKGSEDLGDGLKAIYKA